MFFQILVNLISKRRIFRAPIQLADLFSFPCPEAFSGTFKPGSHCAEIQEQFTKLKSLPGGSSFVFLSYKSPVVPLWLLFSRPSFQSLPSKQRGAFLSPICPLVFGKALKRSHLWSMSSNRMCLCCFAACVP